MKGDTLMSDALVETSYGKVQGEKLGDVYCWKGIPYAKPPVGSLRFRPPVKPDSWEGVRDASQFSPVAAQASSEIMDFLGNDITNMSEDCLYLNVWSPASDNKRRPVLVWIHGGAFVSGSGSSSWYDGQPFAANGDVVVVTINYRLGVFGFLHLGDIGGEEYATSGNCGILDQVAALEWIRDNISSFGGDPNRVTVFGESAGAMSIGVLLGMPAAKGLFQQAILQSGAARNAIPKEKATKVANKILTALNVDSANLVELEQIPVEKLIEASGIVPPMSLSPVIDGVSLPLHPEAAIATGSAKDVSILIGTNKDEYNIFTAFDPMWRNMDQATMQAVFEKTFGPLWPTLSKQLEEELNQDLYNQLMTMQIFTYPAIKLAEHQVKQGAPVWMYRFDWESPVLGGVLKAAHALEIPFVWNTLNKPKTENLTGSSPDRQTVSDQMHQAWIAFARTGNPSTQAMPNWPQYDMETRSTVIFDLENRVEEQPGEDIRVSWEKAMANFV